MGRFFTKTIATALAVLLVALVLGLLNTFVKPILIVLTIPITFFTFGLFLVFINVFIIYMVSEIVPGFHVSGWVTAIIFSFLVSFFSFLIESIIGRPAGQKSDQN